MDVSARKLILELRQRGVRPQDKSSKIFVSGHSMGGAAASVAAWDLCVSGFNVLGVLTFESPLIFNAKAALVYQILLGARTLRVTNQNDPVPHTPSHLYDYAHVGNELYMKDGKSHLCSFKQVQMCRDNMRKGNDDCHCSSQDHFAFLTPQRHCHTKHYLTFDFCRCDASL